MLFSLPFSIPLLSRKMRFQILSFFLAYFLFHPLGEHFVLFFAYFHFSFLYGRVFDFNGIFEYTCSVSFRKKCSVRLALDIIFFFLFVTVTATLTNRMTFFSKKMKPVLSRKNSRSRSRLYIQVGTTFFDSNENNEIGVFYPFS